jgi:activator of 2-hydroxyglutaryl-CoA dehydratase
MDNNKLYLGVDIGSISTKAVAIDKDNNIFARSYLWTEGNPIGAVRRVLDEIQRQIAGRGEVFAVGTTGSARELIGAVLNAAIVKNEITAHAIGTLAFHPEVRTILEIGGQDSKIIILEDGVITDYAMNTLCAAGTGSFL